MVLFEWWPRALAARGLDLDRFVSWLTSDLDMTLTAITPEASGFSNPFVHEASSGDIRRITDLLMVDPDPGAYVELLAAPCRRFPSRTSR